MFPNFELRNVFTLVLVVQWIAHQNSMSMKVYIVLYSKTGGYRVNLLLLLLLFFYYYYYFFLFFIRNKMSVLAKTASSRRL